jgi:hypothetical protein
MIYTSFWGSLWLSDPAHIQEAGRLSQFLADLVNSNYMNVLSQYGVGSGKGSGLFIQASFISNVPAVLKDSDIHNIIQSAINGGAIPDPPITTPLTCWLFSWMKTRGSMIPILE